MLINAAAAAAFPDDIPDFLRTPEVTQIIGEFGPELDRSKDAGKSHDAGRGPGHDLDLGDDGAGLATSSRRVRVLALRRSQIARGAKR